MLKIIKFLHRVLIYYYYIFAVFISEKKTIYFAQIKNVEKN